MAVLVPTPANVQSVLNGATVGDDVDFKGTGTFPAFDVPKRLNLHGNGIAKVSGTGYPIRVKSTAGGSLVEGFAKVSGSTLKSGALILVERAHDVIIRNNFIEDGAQYGIRTYEADRTTISGNEIRGVGTGINVTRNGANSVIGGNIIVQIDKMITDDGTAATNGGDGIQLIDNAPGVVIDDNDFDACRAKTVGGSSWKYDGGAATGYGKCGSVTFRNNRIRNCLNVMEMGTDASKGGVPTGWVIEDNEAWGNADVAPDESRSCVGFFLRANNTFVIRRNKLHELDDFFIRLVGGGGYAGSMIGNLVADNDVWVKPGNSSTYGKNRAYVLSGITPANWGKIEANRVYFTAATTPEIGYMDGKGATKDLATWKTWTGWGIGETWGPVVPPTVDPCAALVAQVKSLTGELVLAEAERDAALAALAQANAAVVVLTTERDAARVKVTTLTAERDAALAASTSATSKFGQAKALASQITAL